MKPSSLALSFAAILFQKANLAIDLLADRIFD
jgi:hypothetical protein